MAEASRTNSIVGNGHSQTVEKKAWPTIEQAERDLDFGQLYRLATETIDDLLDDVERLSKQSGPAGEVGVITADEITTHDQLEAAYAAAIRGRHISEIAPILALRNLGLKVVLPQPEAGDGSGK